MDTNNPPDNIPDLMLELCTILSKSNQTVASNLYRTSLRLLSLYPAIENSIPINESVIVSKIKNQISTQSKENLEKFNLIYSTICNSGIVRRRETILSFLFALSNSVRNASLVDVLSRNVSKEIQNVPSVSETALVNQHSQESIKNLYDSRDKRHFSSSSATQGYSQATSVSSVTWSRNEIPTSSKISASSVTENELMQDVIYSLQGVEGKFLRKEPGGLGFIIDTKSGRLLTLIQKGLVERLTGISFLHNKIRWFCEENKEHGGTICQALIATLNEDLSEYYKTIALLQDNINNPHSNMTLRRMMCVMYEHRTKFEWLSYITEQCADKKGGALITAIYGFLQHGAKSVQEISKRVLKSVCKPLYMMLSRWLLDGVIIDHYGEFFIEAKTIITVERLWQDKYHIRRSMVPSFITNSQAMKILAVGKNINFLKQTYKDENQLAGRSTLQKLFRTMSAETLFIPEQSLEFHEALETIYKETSRRVLNLFVDGYKLYEHLESFRRYMLLEQGDFSSYLLELLAPELNKPVEQIYYHTISSILETSIRATNAQYEDEDTLQRLTIRFMSPSAGDKGWDVFGLNYAVDGPIGTIFQQTIPTYHSLFGALWKIKRREYMLANMKRQQMAMAKMFRTMEELKPAMHYVHCLTGRMIHFIQQTQYYFLEVLECSWAEMQNKVKKAECLDDIIVAHNIFLASLQRGVLLDKESRTLFSHLISIYTFVDKLEGKQMHLYQATLHEKELREEYYRKAQDLTARLTTSDQTDRKSQLETYHDFLNNMKAKLKIYVQMYDQTVKQFLELLAKSGNNELHLLSIKLNFNSFVA